MNSHRRAILQLVAMGRVTPGQAERLLIALNDDRETLWALAACIAISGLAQIHLSQLLPELLHVAQSIMPGSVISLHHALSLATRLFGGML